MIRLHHFVCFLLCVASLSFAQPPSTVPPNGLRDNTPTCHAFVNAKLIPSPGKVIEHGTLVIRDGLIVAIGSSDAVKAPADARVWDCDGKTIYAGLIDGFNELPAEASKSDPALSDALGARYWNRHIVPQVRADRIYKPDAEANKKLRSQGIVARLAAPGAGMLKGTSAVITTSDETGGKSILRDQVGQHASLTVVRIPRSERDSDVSSYPDSPMGALTLVRQALYDAQWYATAWAAAAADPSAPRPERNDALQALADQSRAKLPLIIDAGDDLYFLRADRIGKEFQTDVIVRASGQEYRRLNEIVATKRAALVPVNFPRVPQVQTPEGAMNVSLEDLMDWDIAPENPARLEKAGVRIALTTHGLRDKGSFLTGVRKAVVRGLAPESALRAMTITPAELFGVDTKLGSLEVSKSASFIITDADLFAEKTKILETWVDGKQFDVTTTPLFEARGRWAVKLGERDATITIGGEPERLDGKMTTVGWPTTAPTTAPATTSTTQPSTRPANIELRGVSITNGRLTFTFKADALGFKEGIVQVSVNVMQDDAPTWMGRAIKPDGSAMSVTATRTATAKQVAASQPSTQPNEVASNDTTPDASPPPTEQQQPEGTAQVRPPTTQPDAARGDGDSDRPRRGREPTSKPVIKDALYPVNYPLGDFGYSEPPKSHNLVLFKNATIWTCEEKPRKFVGDIFVEDGKISSVEPASLNRAVGVVGDDVIEINCLGKQITPGIIDCHSHMATDGGVNESGQAITAEVRIGDFINPDDITIYRQLAGGVTAANVLHGSANPIGGQNQVIKLRWSAGAEDLKFKDAPSGIKFALGENVKQSNWDIPDGQRSRYPQTRMGVDQIVRDEFNAGRDYQRAFKDFEKDKAGKLPPRRDLELDAIVEILEHTRLIHCHSYRQDEILALLRTLESFDVKIASLQHILEGYKVADAMAKHGATASTFADWWAYKIEVYDAIPYNGALMNQAGVVVSFNSDDAELGRRLNLEAAKAVKYGGVPEADALKFVTLNPAKQLHIDKFVGSIEVGKDADLVVWRGSPLSTLSRVEQTWVDGRKYFDREDDAKLRTKQNEMRAALIQRALASGETPDEPGGPRERPRDLWPNEDIFCGHWEHQ